VYSQLTGVTIGVVVDVVVVDVASLNFNKQKKYLTSFILSLKISRSMDFEA
jgi:hypothetical protein